MTAVPKICETCYINKLLFFVCYDFVKNIVSYNELINGKWRTYHVSKFTI